MKNANALNSPLNKGHISINNSFDLPKVTLLEKFGVSLYKYGAEPIVSLKQVLFIWSVLSDFAVATVQT